MYAHLQVYSSPLGSAYNRLTQPGTSQGTISFIPAIGKVPSGPLPSDKKPNEVLSFDVQLYPSGLWGPGWIGMPIVFEKANTATANLDSLSVALSYDIPFARSTHYESDAKGSGNFTIRPPDFRIQYGPELATATPHDINLVASATLRLPLAVDFHAQPSALTIFPVVGIEGGNHIHTHEIEDRWEDDEMCIRDRANSSGLGLRDAASRQAIRAADRRPVFQSIYARATNLAACSSGCVAFMSESEDFSKTSRASVSRPNSQSNPAR